MRGHARLLALMRWDRERRLLWPWGGVVGEGYAPDPRLGGEVLRRFPPSRGGLLADAGFDGKEGWGVLGEAGEDGDPNLTATPTLPCYLLGGPRDEVGTEGGEDELDGVPDFVAEVALVQHGGHVQADVIAFFC